MGIGRVLGAVAPIAAGYFAPGAGALFGNATANAIAAGAATGAGIAALSGQDALTGALTGGLGGMSGGSLAGAATDTAKQLAGQTATNVGKEAGKSMFSNAAGVSSAIPNTTSGLQANQLASTVAGGQGPNMNLVNPVSSGIGIGEATSAAVSEPGMFLENLGGGSKAMGAGKLGLTGLGVAGSAGAFDPDMPTYEDSIEDKYDPRRRLDLSMDTGIGTALGRDSGLRLLAEGGDVKNFVIGGSTGGPLAGNKAEYTPSELSTLAEYGVVPQYQAPLGIGASQSPTRVPVMGVVDVGGKFVADPKGDITDIEYTKRFDYILNPKKKKDDDAPSGDMDKINEGAKAGLGVAPALAIAQSYAEQQESPVKSQTLGLQALEAGGYLETGGQVGDGMSDQIPANIDGMQEARLSDGEFVVPADVVSHLGNGSSDAGAKRLYEMMDKVRMARTGTKKQGKEIKPERYMPA